MKIGRILALCLCTLILATAVFAVDAPVRLPAWPRDFSIRGTDGAAIPVPNPGAGTIKINITWTGSPLVITVRGADGKIYVPTATKSAPSCTMTVDAASVSQAQCPVFVVAMKLAGAPAPRSTASGKVAVESERVDVAKLLELLRPFQAQAERARIEMLRSSEAFNAEMRAKVAALNQAAVTQNTARVRSLQTQANTERTTYANMTQSIAMSGRTGARVPVWSATNILKGVAGKIRPAGSLTLAPALRSVTPGNGISGSQVTIAGVGLTQDATEVYFTIAAGVTVQANITSFQKADDGTVTMQVQVPDKAGVTGQYDGQVFAKATQLSPVVTTNSLPFHYEPIVAPGITYVDPVEVSPQVTVNVDGNGFTNTDKLRFILPGVFDSVVQTTFVNSTRLSAQIPLYSARQISNGWVCVARPAPSGSVSGQQQALIFRPTIPAVTSVPGTEAADAPIMIRGMAFGPSGEVHAVDEVGQDTLLTVDSWSDTHIIARTPAIVGFTGAKAYRIYVKNGNGKSDLQNLSLTPTIDHVLMVFDELKQSRDFTQSGECSPSSCVSSNDLNLKWMCAHHTAGMFSGCRGDDTWFNSRTLRNGWTVESVDFRNNSYGGPLGAAGARLDSSRPGSSSPYVLAHWWCDAMWGDAYYNFAITVQGPKGTQY